MDTVKIMTFQCLNCGYKFEDENAEREHYLPICPECGEVVESMK